MKFNKSKLMKRAWTVAEISFLNACIRKHPKKFHFKSCRDCEHGLNIVASFVIDESYKVFFGPLDKMKKPTFFGNAESK